MKYLVLLMFATVLFPSQSLPSVVDSGVAVNSTAFSSQRKIVRDRRGDLYAIYLKPAGNLSQVYLAKSIDNGSSWSQVGQVSQGAYQSVRASVAISGNDQIFVFWTKFIGEYGQIFYRVYAQNSWSDEYQLTSGDAYSGYPSACFDSLGHIHLVWYGFDGTAYQVFYMSFNGTGWSASTKLSQGYPDSVNPTIAVDASNNIHVAWYKSNGHHYQINYIRWSRTWGTQTILSSASADSYNPSMAMNSKGQVFVVWDEGQGPITQIYYSVYDGSSWTQEVPLTKGPGAENPSIATDRQDRVYVVYDKSDGQIYLITYDGAKWSAEEQIPSSGVNTYPSLRWSFLNNPLAGPGGTIDLVWTSKEGSISNVRYNPIKIPSSESTQTTQTVEGQLPVIGSAPVSIISAIGIVALLAVFVSFRIRKTQ